MEQNQGSLIATICSIRLPFTGKYFLVKPENGASNMIKIHSFSQAHLLCILQSDRLSRRQLSIYLSQNTQILSNFYRLQNVSRCIKVQHLVEAVVLLYLLNICCQSGALVK